MKYVIVKRQSKKDPDNPKRQYLAHTSVICRSQHTYYGNLQDKYVLLFNKLKDGESYIKQNLSGTMDFMYFEGKEINSHICIRFEDVNIWTRRKSMSLESAKKSLANAVKNRMVEEESKKQLTKEQINANIDRLFRNAEENERFRRGDYSKPLDLPSYTTVRKAPHIERRPSKHMTISVIPKGGSPHNSNEIHANILIKDMNSGLYILVPQNGECRLVKKDDCTLFSNSNQSHYIVSNIQARSFMASYHDMKLIEVYMETDKPIRECQIIHKKSIIDEFPVIDDIIRYSHAVSEYTELQKELVETRKLISENSKNITEIKRKRKPIKKPRR